MNGKEHYEEAERLLDSIPTAGLSPAAVGAMVARALVHATLAQAQATLVAADSINPGRDVLQPWGGDW